MCTTFFVIAFKPVHEKRQTYRAMVYKQKPHDSLQWEDSRAAGLVSKEEEHHFLMM